MKKLHLVLISICLALIMLLSCACAQTDGDTNTTDSGTIGGSKSDDASDARIYPSTSKEYSSSASERDGWFGMGSSDIGGLGGNYQIAAGQLTCGVTVDQLEYAHWLSLFAGATTDENQQPVAAGIFNGYVERNYGFNTLNMVKVVVKNGAKAVPYATVTIKADGKTEFTAQTNANGIAYLFTSGKGGEIEAAKDNKTVKQSITSDVKEVELSLAASTELSSAIDLLFVVDTTGSMGDELEYLKSEIASVVDSLKNNNAVTVRVGLLFYRDHGDQYVTRFFDFSADIDAVQANISAQSANGGGDYEEAVDEALNLAINRVTYKDEQGVEQSFAFSWSDDATKILIHVLDAPIHDGEQFESNYVAAVNKLAEEGVRVITVASSGVNTKCQYTFRAVSLLTGGRYVFLTDHSGIGGSHEQPDTTDYTVEYLNSCLIRLVDELHTGVATTAVPINAQNDAQ